MAESIIIHCSRSDRAELLLRIEARFECVSKSMWRFPSDDYLVSVTPYDDFEREYDQSEKDDVIARLGGTSIASFNFEIRRSRSDEACDMLEDFVRLDCCGFNFVVDDMFRILDSADLRDINDFLDVYRYKK